ncbi:MAG: glycosyltransferase [Bacteroidia bacterium]|nr:glycosyltransferase [Bacteroidia bacterium]HQV00336.1 glycosyltransferase [Bacteroidia bacterium]
MNVLYLSYDGMTDPLGQSQVLPYLFGLSKAGYKIHLISFEKPERNHLVSGLKKEITEQGITWHPLVYHKKPAVLSTLFDILILKQKVIKLHTEFNFQLVHCRSYITAIAGLHLKQKRGVSFIFDMRGFYADERVDGGLWPQDKFVYKFIYQYFKQLEKKLLINADAIVSLTNSAKNIMQNWQLKKLPLPITVIPCCADLAHFNFMNSQKTITKTQLKIADDALVITYLGAIGTWYMLDEMLLFFKSLLQVKPDALFLFITTESANTIFNAAQKLDISQTQIRVVSANRQQVPSYLLLADLAIFFIKPTFSKKASSPTKQAELMGMGLPIICNAGVGDTDYIVNETNSGIALPDLTVETFKKTADNLNELLCLDKHHIYEGAIRFFDLNKGIEQYQQVYQRLLKQ